MDSGESDGAWTLNGYVLNYATVSTRLLMAMLSTMLHGFRLNTEGEIIKGIVTDFPPDCILQCFKSLGQERLLSGISQYTT
jgi:hypothetical protein